MRLADFARVHIRAGETRRVSLTVTPKYHSVVQEEAREGFWAPTILVEAGTFTVHAGGGQPDFFAGALSASVSVTSAARLTTRYTCASEEDGAGP